MSAAHGTFHGRLTADPILRTTPGGAPVANFTLAHTVSRKNADGVWEDYGDTLYLRVSAWYELAENVAGSLHKGDPVVVVGTVGVRNYKTDAGEDRTEVRCNASSVAVDLRWAMATVMRIVRGGAPVEDAPWATPSAAAAA